MYGTEAPFIEKWRAAIGYIEEDLEAGYPKVWASSKRWPGAAELRERCSKMAVAAARRARRAIEEYGLDSARFSAEAWAERRRRRAARRLAELL